MKALWFFEDANLFSLLCPHRFKQFKASHAFRIYNKKDYVYFEEDQSNKIFLIVKGKVKIGYYREDGKEVIKAILTKGDLFGEKAILGETKRTEFAQSLTKGTEVCPVSVSDLQSIMRESKSFSLRIHKFIGFKFRKLERRIDLLLYRDIQTRFLEFMESLCEEYGHYCDETGHRVIEHPYTQKDIASLIGVSRSNLNMVMNELKTNQVIDFDRNYIRILKRVS